MDDTENKEPESVGEEPASDSSDTSSDSSDDLASEIDRPIIVQGGGSGNPS
jgi:hypothetical protein